MTQASSSANDCSPIQASAPSARLSLLLAGKLSPQELRYYESEHVSHCDMINKLESCLAELVGGKAYPGGWSCEPCKYIPPRGWACFERAQERLEVLKEVYPELRLMMQVMVEKVGPTCNRAPFHIIRWTEVVLGLEYNQLLEIS